MSQPTPVATMAALAGNSFNAPIEGHTVIAGNTVTGGTVTFNLNSTAVQLPIAIGASFDSHDEEHNATCLPDTRVDLLREIHDWTNNPDAKAIFWLNGMAGTGKSTVSRTIARDLYQAKRLGASFFFKRGETDRGSMSKFIPTLAGQLVRAEPALANHIKIAVDSDPAIFGKRLQVQFEELIVKPLSGLRNAQSTTIMIVVDALDECERDDDVKVAINLFTRFNALRSPSCRVFLTSRPELPIRLGFNSIRGTYQDLVLHELPQDVIEHDISTFLKQQLSVIRSDYNLSVSQSRHLAPDWPGDLNLQSLAQMAVPLFIFAATMCRFIGDRRLGLPHNQLAEVLQFTTRSQESQLDATYLPVLERLIAGLSARQTEKVIQRFRKVVGPIVNLAAPLPISSLEQILEISSADINNLLDMLHSVIDVPMMETHPVRILHLSFRDFLIDPEKCESSPFWIDEKKAHHEIGIGCLRILERHLREDVCHLRMPGTLRSSINPKIIDRYLPSEVKYAVLYWVHHVMEAGMSIHDDGPFDIFLREHFLHWLEALSLTGRIMELHGMMESFLSLLNSTDSPKLFAFMTDGAQFATTNLSGLDEAPLQVYSSAIAFAPGSNIVRQTFKTKLAPWILLAPEPEADWDHCHLTLEAHGGATSLHFSPNSQILASVHTAPTPGSHIIELWRVDRGQRLARFKLTEKIMMTAFAPDSKRFAAVAGNGLCVWEVDTGDCIDRHPLSGEIHFSAEPFEVALFVGNGLLRGWTANPTLHSEALLGFSPDGETVLSSRSGNDIYHWSVDTGECIRQFKLDTTSGNWRYAVAVAFSPDSLPLVVTHTQNDPRLQLWRLDTGECIQDFPDLGTKIMSNPTFAFSWMLAGTTLGDGTVHVSRVDTGQCVKILQGYGYPTAVAVSPNSSLIALGFWGEALKVWSMEPNEEVQNTLRYGSRVKSVQFSPDLRHIVSVSTSDGSARLWRTDTGKNEHHFMIERTGESLSGVVFSPDSLLLAFFGSSGSVIVRWVHSGDLMLELNCQGHVWFRSFSYDSRFLASVSYGFLYVWEVHTGERAHALVSQGEEFNSISFSPTSPFIASCHGTRCGPSSSSSIRLWNYETGICFREFHLKDRLNSAKFSPDSTRIVSVSDGGVRNEWIIRVWRVNTGDYIQTIKTDMLGDRHKVVISPTSTLIAGLNENSLDCCLMVWQVRTGRCIQKVSVSNATDIEFDRNGTHIHTDIAVIAIKDPDGLAERPDLDLSQCRVGYGFSGDGRWITWNGTAFFRLPPDYRPICAAISGSNVVLGCKSGRVIIMRFAVDGLMD
ncbi:hypothetical protein B0T10DRAFT_551503 [Thelonectria olida]|uniref:Mitochondrial division protein 1 n=1 Tax=Thelonectria olida TaxID=1576542 RepID=A0A9P8VX54_9HYPO|nr:hypothetical protein B0T10DRAFT_551503 [Thelonectria olida]